MRYVATRQMDIPCRFIAIEPYPSAKLQTELPPEVELWRVPLQQVSLE